MKKMITFILAVLIAFSAITASAATPDFLYEVYKNYTSEQTMSIKLKSGDDIKNLLEELEALDEISKHIDVEKLLESLLSLDYKATGQFNISDDFKKMELASQVETSSVVEPNNNLKIGVDTKTGVWYRFDVDEGKLEMIQSTPALNKYAYYDVMSLLPEEEKEEILGVVKLLCNETVMTQIQKFSADLFVKYADVKISGTKCTIKIDNDALISIADELIAYVIELTETITGEEYPIEIPSLKGLKLLGNKGIAYKYSLTGGKPSKIEMTADISLDISNIYTHFTGEEWEYETKGIVELEIESTGKMSKYGKTKVDFPKLTEENSFDALADVIPNIVEDEYEQQYPYYWVSGFCDKLPSFDGEWYVPLRITFVDAFEDSVEIGYADGIVTLTSDYFPGFKTLKLTVGSDVAYIDGEEVKISKIVEENGTSYISVKTLEEIFGWELTSFNYNYLENELYYAFRTVE